jgi:integrase
LICAIAVKADASMLETTKTQYAVRDTRVIMQEPLVRILTVMDAVYNGLERVYRPVNRGGPVTGMRLGEKVVWQMLKRYAAEVEVPRLAPHDLRRTCAKLCRAAGG